MKAIVIILLLMSSLAMLYSITATDILASKDVIAYVCMDGIYLMDINSGSEIKVPKIDMEGEALWDSKGEHLYYMTIALSQEDYTLIASIYEIILPTLNVNQLGEINFKDDNVTDASINLGADGNIYIYGLKPDPDGNEDVWIKELWGIYNPVSANLNTSIEDKQQLPVLYTNPLMKPIVTEGYGIVNKHVSDKDKHYELYNQITRDNKKTEFIRISTLTKSSVSSTLTTDPIQFTVSPDDSIIVLSYSYYSGEDESTSDYTYAANRNGSKFEMLNDSYGLKSPNLFVWTKDSRLLFTQMTTDGSDNVNLNLLDNNWNVKTLKTLRQYDIPLIYYRYR